MCLPPPSRYSGTVTYRGYVQAELVPEWPAESWFMWLGKGKHFLVYPMRGGALINFVGFVPADQEMKELWSATGDPDQLRREFADWDPKIGYLLRQVTTTFRSALHDRDPLPSWTKGRLTLLGDAAHAMLPHLGQGANQSIEDGMALATMLANTDRTTVLAALLAYERLRRERTAKVQTNARANGLRYELVPCRPEYPGCRDRRAWRVPQAALRPRRRSGSARCGPGAGLIKRIANSE